MRAHFFFKRLLVLCTMVLAASLAMVSVASAKRTMAGRVVAVQGKLTVTHADKSTEQLKRRSKFYVGDTLSTPRGSQAQLKYTDDTVMLLRPSTVHQVVSYRFDKNNPENSSNVSNLVKGGFRAVTGQIAKANPEAVSYKTPVATIGIRGTDFAVLFVTGKLMISVNAGVISITNDEGTLLLGEGQRFRFGTVISKDAIPMGTSSSDDLRGEVCI